MEKQNGVTWKRIFGRYRTRKKEKGERGRERGERERERGGEREGREGEIGGEGEDRQKDRSTEKNGENSKGCRYFSLQITIFLK